MTRMTGPDCAVMCNLINIHARTHTHSQNIGRIKASSTDYDGLRGYVQFNITICKSIHLYTYTLKQHIEPFQLQYS